ncbi:MAG: hypothetical protein CVT92_17240 [Bacteroidetes bacterium HGW-Bacteroidetes-1]|nr:MAG: hypothetical protein CVT92_17240 [Bacteroidetes bacterium HGW-Bacteroidetes-1]
MVKMKNFNFLIAILSISIFFSGCNNSDKEVIPTDCTDVHWTHNESDNGQDKWIDLCTGYNACGGQSQSPVNISAAITDTTLSELVFSYSSTPAEIENNGHTIEFVCEEGSKLIISTKEYELLQFHYHAQSEHQMDGMYYPLEVHFVHKASESDYAVVGVFFEEGEENELFTKFLGSV